MSFNISLSGLNAASADLGATSNNIANASTVGFKESRAEFADVYALSPFGNGKTVIGSGVLLSSIAQQFNQGNLDFTENSLDLAINGPGFFVLSPSLGSSEHIFSRAGAFGVDDQGFVVNSTGQYLKSFPVNADGTVTSTSLSTANPLRLPSAAGTPRATMEVDIGMNLPAEAVSLDPSAFNPNDSATFTNSTSVTVFDSLGDAHIATFYFTKDRNAMNQWTVHFQIDGSSVDLDAGAEGTVPYATLAFDAAGNYQSQVPTTIKTVAHSFSSGANPLSLNVDIANNTPTQFASNFAVNALHQDGFTTGRLNGLDIGDDGLVQAAFTNGQFEALGKIALANFSNPQGLQQLGNTAWRETLDSGAPLPGEGGTGSFGLIRSGALESSNVDLTEELVSLITAQRNFQANAKSIETASSITQTILNIR